MVLILATVSDGPKSQAPFDTWPSLHPTGAIRMGLCTGCEVWTASRTQITSYKTGQGFKLVPLSPILVLRQIVLTRFGLSTCVPIHLNL